MSEIWIAEDGTKFLVKNMSDQHVRNAFKMVCRVLETERLKNKRKSYVTLNGDMAQQFNDSNQENDDLLDEFGF